MENVSVQDCKVISISGDKASFIVTIGSSIVFISSDAYHHSGKVTSILPNGFYMKDKKCGTCFIEWNDIVDIMKVNNGSLLKFLQN